jgi:hypothetical protein
VDRQDLINELLAAALETTDAMNVTARTATLFEARQPEAEAALVMAATVLSAVTDVLIRAADGIQGLPPSVSA